MSLIRRLIDKSDVVSFDVFDTILERNVQVPSDIFRIVGMELFNSNEEAQQLSKNRILAERIAREKNRDKEINIDDIYKELRKEYENYKEIKAKEIIVELSSCKPILGMVENLNYAIKKGKRVFLISDMYLPKPIILKILESCNIRGFEEIYISCEYGCNKLTGKLFEYVCNDKNIKKDKFIHFGDSIKADVIGAYKAGIVGYPTHRKNRIKRFFTNG